MLIVDRIQAGSQLADPATAPITEPFGRHVEVCPAQRASVAAAGSARLVGRLCVPDDPVGAVVFAYGSGRGITGARNRYVARYLYRHRFATLMLDLLTDPESIDRHAVFDIALLGHRLLDAAAWLSEQPELSRLPRGYFGAGTGAAAAVWAAAEQDARVDALVLLSGRPDLAGRSRLASVRAATLLVVGARDAAVLDLNRRARSQLHCENQLFVVSGADHAFEDPRALAVAAGLIEDWLSSHLAPGSASVPAESAASGAAHR